MQGRSYLRTRAATIKRLMRTGRVRLSQMILAFTAAALVGLVAVLSRALCGIAGLLW